MKIIILDRTGHTEVDASADEAIALLEKEMNRRPTSVMVDAPGQSTRYLRKAEDARSLDPDAVVTVAPQLQGG